MTEALLDTDILSYVTDARYPEINLRATQYLRVFKTFSVSSVTVAEIMRGLSKPSKVVSASRFAIRAESFNIYPLGLREAFLAG